MRFFSQPLHYNRARSTRGIALLEMAVLAVVVAPALLALGALAWYYYEVSLMRSALSQTLNDISVKSLRISMGRMDGWLRTRHVPLEAEFPPIAEQIHTRIAAQLGVDSDHGTGTGYVIDVALGYGSFRVDTHGGFIFEPARRHQQPMIVTYPPHTVDGLGYPSPEENETASDLTFRALRLLAPNVISPEPGEGEGSEPRFELPSSYAPSPFAVPSGQFGTRLQLHYGPSHAYGGASTHPDNRSWRPVNDYLRTTLVLGAAIVIDFNQSALGRLAAHFKEVVPDGTDNIRLPTKIAHVEVMSPRMDF